MASLIHATSIAILGVFIGEMDMGIYTLPIAVVLGVALGIGHAIFFTTDIQWRRRK